MVFTRDGENSIAWWYYSMVTYLPNTFCLVVLEFDIYTRKCVSEIRATNSGIFKWDFKKKQFVKIMTYNESLEITDF